MYFKHKHYKKGEYIFHNFAKSDNFYGVITGTISIRGINCKQVILNKYDEIKTICPIDNVNTIMFKYEKEEIDKKRLHIKNNLNQLRYDLEYEKILFLPGMCFGEWGIVNKTTRSASAYCAEDTDVFYLEKEYFINYFRIPFYNSVSSKKHFLNSIFEGLAKYFSYIVPLFYNYGDIIYTINDEAKYLYIIYQGECSFFDNLIQKENTNENLYSNLQRNNIKIKTILTQGCLIGMESVVYYGNKNIKYENNVIALQDYTIIYQLNVDLLYYKGYTLFDNVFPIYKAQMGMNDLLQKKKDVLEKEKKKKEEATKINNQNGSADSKRQKSLKRIYIAPFLKEKFCTNKKKKSINSTKRIKFINHNNNNNNNCFVSQYISTETDTNTPLSLIKSKLQIKKNKIISNTSENTINDKHDGFISSFSPSISESKTNSFYGIRINLHKKRTRTRNNKSPDSLNVTDCKNNNNNSAEKTKSSQTTRNISNYFGVGTIDNKSILNALNNFSLSFMKKKSRGFLSKSPKNSNINSFNVTYNSGNYKLPFVHSFSHTLRKNKKVLLK